MADRLVYEAVRNKLEDFELFEGEILKSMKGISQSGKQSLHHRLGKGTRMHDSRPETARNVALEDLKVRSHVNRLGRG